MGFAGSKSDTSVSAPEVSGIGTTKGWDFAWALGVQAHISSVGARLEYEQFNIPHSNGAKIASLSAFVNF